MANQVIVSEKFSLQIRDFLKGAGIAIVTAVFPLVQESLQAGQLTFNWKILSIAGLGAFFAYIGKNFFEQPSVKTTYTSNDKAKDVAKTISNG